MLKRISTVAVGSAAALALLAAPAAAYTLNTDTNRGWVGKGEVQTVFGLNNKVMQTAHNQVTFSYAGTQTYEFDCEWDTGVKNVTHHVNTKTVDRTVTAAVADRDRRTGQWTGWYITLGSVVGDASQPTDADCGAEGNEMKTIVPGSIATVGGESPTLFATHNGVTKALTLTPAA
jgi:hypothetical protein